VDFNKLDLTGFGGYTGLAKARIMKPGVNVPKQYNTAIVARDNKRQNEKIFSHYVDVGIVKRPFTKKRNFKSRAWLRKPTRWHGTYFQGTEFPRAYPKNYFLDKAKVKYRTPYEPPRSVMGPGAFAEYLKWQDFAKKQRAEQTRMPSLADITGHSPGYRFVPRF